MTGYTTIFTLLGGIGLFIYGMHIMSEGLQNYAGDKLRKIVEVLTTNTLSGILIGTGIAAIIQSSSITASMVMGFVNTEIMNLSQAASVIIGINIGTTITAQLIAFRFASIAPLILAIGSALFIFINKSSIKYLGEIILGFGILFVGLNFMENAMKPIGSLTGFEHFITYLGTSPALGIMIGILLTALLRSSSAFIALLMALASNGGISFSTTFPMLLGSNIGACVSAIIISKDANKNSKRTALIHLIFNAAGTIIFMLIFKTVNYVIPFLGGDVLRQIANAHTIFNITSAVIIAPIIPLLIKLSELIIPGEDKKSDRFILEYIDRRLLETPSIAVSQVVKETVRMGKLALENVEKSYDCFPNYNTSAIEGIYKREAYVNYLEKEITSFLVPLSNAHLSEHESKVITSLFHIVNDIERISDHSENLIELAELKSGNFLKFSDEALTELKFMYEIVINAVTLSIMSLEDNDLNAAMKVLEIEKKIDRIEKQLRADHIDRLNKGICIPSSGTIFLDAISNLERIGDHSNNIAQIVLAENIEG